MEVYSTQTPVRPGVTRLACFALLLIALLQAVHMVRHKRNRGQDLLDDRFVVGRDISLRVPRGFQRDHGAPPGVVVFLGRHGPRSAAAALYVVTGSPVSPETLQRIEEIVYHVSAPPYDVILLQPASCRVGDYKTVMRGVEFRYLDEPPIVIRQVEDDRSEGNALHLWLRMADASDRAARVLMRAVAGSVR